MTEYDFSPEAYDRYLATQTRIAKWVDNTERHRPEFQAPFGHGGLQQEQPPPESSSSGATSTPPPRYRDREEHHPRRHHKGSEDLDSGGFHTHEHQSDHGHTSRSHPTATGHTHHQHQHQQYQIIPLQQQYASPHVQIYGAPGNVHHSQQPMHASYSYGGANSASYGYPSYAAPDSPPHYSAGDSSHKSNKKSKRSHSHQPDAAAAAAAIAAYYGGTGYISPPAAHGHHHHQHSYPSPPASGGRSGKNGYFVVDQSYCQPGSVQVIQGQYPPVAPIVYRTR